MADDAAVKDEKPMEKKTKAAPRKKITATTKSNKIVWKVFDVGYKEVACFPFSEKEKAYAKAEDLSAKSKKNYFVNEVTVPMEN